jgi:uncharacterized protein
LEGWLARATLLFYVIIQNVLIDAHTHIFSPDIIRKRADYIQLDAEFAALYSAQAARMITAEQLIDSMDKSGIDMSIVCGFSWSQAELCAESNDYILESIAHYPKRLSGLAVIRIEDGDSALREVERCVRGGVRGLGELRPQPRTMDIAFDSLWSPIITLLIEQHLFCLFHSSEPVGHAYAGKGELTPEVLYPFIARHPDLRVVLAHWGGGLPFYCLMPEVKKALTNTWFDTAASPFLYSPRIYKQAIDLVGADRILFGSDYPLMPQSRAITEIKRLYLPDEAQEAILGINAGRLLEIEGA